MRKCGNWLSSSLSDLVLFSYKCRMGQLTAEGALQLVKLGTHLHESYASTGLFEGACFLIMICKKNTICSLDINNADIEFYASPYPRTFQSAIAFASAFFYVIKNLPRLPLRFSNNTYFCLGPECHCPNYMKVRKSAEQVSVMTRRYSSTTALLYRRLEKSSHLSHRQHFMNAFSCSARWLDLKKWNIQCSFLM